MHAEYVSNVIRVNIVQPKFFKPLCKPCRTGLARPWGEVLNDGADRLADVALFSGLALAPTSDGRLGAAALVAVLLSSYLGVLSKTAGGPRQYGGVMGKADRMIYLSITTVLAFLLPAYPVLTFFLIVVLVGLVLTIAQRARATYADLQPGP